MNLSQIESRSEVTGDWLLPLQPYSAQYSLAVDTDDLGNIFMTTGTLKALTQIGEAHLPLSGESKNVFVAKISPFGEVLWVICSEGGDSVSPSEIYVHFHE